MFLQHQGAVCTQGAPSGPNSTLRIAPVFNFSVPATASFFRDTVFADVLAEARATNFSFDTLFLDETDCSYCGYFSSHMHTSCAGQMPASVLLPPFLAKMAAVGVLARQLDAGGVTPLVSSKNILQRALEAYPNAPAPCIQPEDHLLAAMHGALGQASGSSSGDTATAAASPAPTWLRFYEFWLREQSADEDARQILNAHLETQTAGGPVGVVVRAEPLPSASPDAVADDLRYKMAAFLVVQTEHSYFGMSTGWYDADWVWWPAFDTVRCGRPTAAMVHSTPHVFDRTFEHCTVHVDTSSKTGVITQTRH